MKVIVSTYEVLINNDNSYYTHCYHSLIKSYNNGKLISTDRDYSQAIGGQYEKNINKKYTFYGYK